MLTRLQERIDSPEARAAAQRPQTSVGPESSFGSPVSSSGYRQKAFDEKTAQSPQNQLGEKQDFYEWWVATKNYLVGRSG